MYTQTHKGVDAMFDVMDENIYNLVHTMYNRNSIWYINKCTEHYMLNMFSTDVVSALTETIYNNNGKTFTEVRHDVKIIDVSVIINTIMIRYNIDNEKCVKELFEFAYVGEFEYSECDVCIDHGTYEGIIDWVYDVLVELDIEYDYFIGWSSRGSNVGVFISQVYLN